MQPSLPLVGSSIKQKGTGAGTWHRRPIVPATAALGSSAPVLLGCHRSGHVERGRRMGMWPWRPPLPTAVLGGSGEQDGAPHVLYAIPHLF